MGYIEEEGTLEVGVNHVWSVEICMGMCLRPKPGDGWSCHLG